VRIDVTPEPSPDELAAIRIALERLANAEPAAAFRRRLWSHARLRHEAAALLGLAREAITDSMMVLALPGRVLALGHNLTDAFPRELDDPTDPELKELLARYEPVPPTPDDCGARDWSSLEQRMHYIVHLFCAFHLHDDLSRSPFTPQQVASFSGGIVPDGEL